MEPSRLILQLDGYFSRFDEIVEGVGLEKIKTIGDGYMAVGGLPESTILIRSTLHWLLSQCASLCEP
jgi:class 3 adenylate cyclase